MNFVPWIATVKGSKRIPVVIKELQKLGISKFELNEQIPPEKKTFENVTLSCTDNHLQIYKKALLRNLPFICVFEDDIYVKDPSRFYDGVEQIRLFIEEYPASWDLIYLGHFPWKIGKKVSSNREKREKISALHQSISWCTHAYFISARAMKYMLNFSPLDMMKIGRLASSSIFPMFDLFFREGGGIDTFLAYAAFRQKLQSFALVPMIVYQHSIANWEFKARFIERIASTFPFSEGLWASRLFQILWVLLWLIIYLSRKFLARRKA